MSAAEGLYATFLRLRAALVGFASQRVPSDVAAGLVGESLAFVVGWAIEGRQTLHGPYAVAFEHLVDAINIHAECDWTTEPVVQHDEIPFGCASLIGEVALAYGAVFDAAYDARLSLADVTFIKALIAACPPPELAEATLMELLTLQRRDLEPLRRAFFACEEHEPAGGPVCRFSGRITQREQKASRAWLSGRTRQEVNPEWLASAN